MLLHKQFYMNRKLNCTPSFIRIFYVSDNNKINVDKEEIDKMINCDTFSWYKTEKCYVACMIYGDDDDDVRNNMEKVYW